MFNDYEFIPTVPSAEDFCRVRICAGMMARSLGAAKKGLPNSCFGITVRSGRDVIGMGRIVGDGALNFEIVDVAVIPSHQGKGLGRKIIEFLISWLESNAYEGAYITLIADEPKFYEKFGFKLVTPESEGMSMIWSKQSGS
ncbi:GNAT family N-acetyltransferase [Dickeya chrysanthemi]|uniref:GNAT family N-acetyltransferase n=1 Tax=Dickeya chrysanthemi TaxID=556 RepID=UPI000489CEA6|nr:GNAT family N-acetyltransferase [Dickeya chrysanthemi]